MGVLMIISVLEAQHILFDDDDGDGDGDGDDGDGDSLF